MPCPSGNCNDTTQNAPCNNCTGCVNVYLSDCLQYTGTPSSCSSYINVKTNDKLTTIIESLLASICDLNGRSGTNPTKTIKFSLTAAQIKTGFSIPILVSTIPAPGVGKFIKITGFDLFFNYGSATFTSSYLNIYSTDVTHYLAGTNSGFLGSSSTTNIQGTISSSTGAFATNAQLHIAADADSAVGNSTIDCYITYQIITL